VNTSSYRPLRSVPAPAPTPTPPRRPAPTPPPRRAIYVTIPSAVMAKLRADTIEEAARFLAANGSVQASRKLQAYAQPYREDQARGRAAMTRREVFEA
jgi:hypothetical protein